LADGPGEAHKRSLARRELRETLLVVLVERLDAFDEVARSEAEIGSLVPFTSSMV